jgi:hypothetical protein
MQIPELLLTVIRLNVNPLFYHKYQQNFVSNKEKRTYDRPMICHINTDMHSEKSLIQNWLPALEMRERYLSSVHALYVSLPYNSQVRPKQIKHSTEESSMEY